MSRPTLRDLLRTAFAVLTLAPEITMRLLWVRGQRVPSTATPDGAAGLRQLCSKALRRFGIELEIRGADQVPQDGGFVFMWNQESHLDHLILGAAIPRPFLSLYNNEVARFPLYGEHMRRSGHFHVDRKDEAQWRPQIERAALAVRDGACVLLSPEGTRSPDGRLLPMKRGAFLLAEASERPIVCVTVLGGHRLLPRGAWIVRSGRIRVVFSAPFHGDEAAVVATFEATKREYTI